MLNTIVIKIILKITEFGANYLPIIDWRIGKFELIIYYAILILLFLNIQNDKIKKEYESK